MWFKDKQLDELKTIDEQMEYANTIVACGQLLLQLVNDVLLLSKIDSESEHGGDHVANLAPMDLSKFLSGICSIFTLSRRNPLVPICHEMSVGGAAAAAQETPVWIMADEGRLRQILVNLLSK